MAMPVMTPVGELERFLVQDVILTLGNLRGSLAWVAGDQDSGLSPAYRAGLERIERQIELLEDRARTLCGTPRPERLPHPAPSAAAYAEGSGLTLAAILRDALGERDEAVDDFVDLPAEAPTASPPLGDDVGFVFRTARRPVADGPRE